MTSVKLSSAAGFRLVILCLVLSANLWSQSKQGVNQLKGVVVDSETKAPLDFVNITLFSEIDSTALTGGITNQSGEFQINQLPDGNYYIRLKFIGYRERLIGGIRFEGKEKVKQLGQIQLERADRELKEVVIEIETPLMETSIDKKVFNVGEDQTARGGTAIDVLNNVPSVDIDQDGQISLRGNSNVTILIDGRPSSLSGSSRQAILDAIPAASIERIEIVTNPSAKYDPDGMSGIINIVLKKNKLRGLNGNLDLTYGTGNNPTGSFSVNLRNNKINAYATYSYRYYEGYRNFNSYRERKIGNETEFLTQTRTGHDLNNGHTVKTGLDYTLKPGHIIGVSLTGSSNLRSRSGLLTNELSTTNGVYQLWQRNSDEPNRSKSLDVNLNYQWTLKEKKGELMLDVNQSWGTGMLDGVYDEYDLIETSISPSRMENLKNPDSRSVLTASLDFVRNFKSIKLETGAKAIINDNTQTQFREIYDPVTQTYYPDLSINNEFRLVEQIYSLYGIYGHKIKKFGYQLGMRLEQALVRPELLTTNEKYTNDYFSFFPSAHFSYELPKKGEFFLSYSRRINRPSANNLNPFTEYSDPFNLRTGNPALRPEYINSFELGYNKNWKKLNVNTTGYYRYSTDVIQRIRTFYEDGTGATTYDNLDNTINFGLEAVAMYRPLPIWRNTLSGNVYQTFLQTSNPDLMNNSGIIWSAKVASSIDLFNRTTTLQVNLRYNSPRVMPQGIVQFKPALDASIQRLFLDKKLVVSLRVSDIFDWQGFYMDLNTPNVRQESTFKWQSRRVFISLSYKFGKMEVGGEPRKRRSGSGGNGGGDMDF
jgi:outer membrane receptor protein involved in Fe transport